MADKATRTEAAKIGGRARAASQTAEERAALASMGGRAVWAHLSASERSEIMRQRAKKRRG